MKLFLHSGPGGSAAVERLWFGGHPPSDMEFWDQPILSGQQCAFSKLLEACERKLNEVAIKGNGPAGLVGHGFGCALALNLAAKRPERVKNITLISPTVDCSIGVLNLGQKLLTGPNIKRENCREIKAAISYFKKSKRGSKERQSAICGILDAASKVPNYEDVYWAKDEARERYKNLSKSLPAPDTVMRQTILNDYILGGYADIPIILCSAKIYFGEKDPCVNYEEDSKSWQKLIPQARIQLLPDCGHFPHLESPLAIL